MKHFTIYLPLVLSLFGSSAAQESTKADDWHKHVFKAPCSAVFPAAKRVAAFRHDLVASDEAARTVRFRVGMTAWSWGYTMTIALNDSGEDSCSGEMAITKKGGSSVSWGSGSKETKKVWAWIEEDLQRQKAKPGT